MCYDAVIFDNDGVLTEPTASEVYRAAVRAAFAEFGADPTTEGVDGVIHGSLTRIRRVCDIHDLDLSTFWPRHEAVAAAAQRDAIESGTKGLYDDVDALSDLDSDLAVVSNNQQETIGHILDCFDLQDTFEVAYGREPTIDGIRRKKPSPHYLNRALSALDVDNALYVGDSNVDILAASRAGVDSAFVRRPHRTDYELVADPTYEIESLSDLTALC